MPQHDLIVIGGGPGGYVAAIRGAQLGLNVACIDENDVLGGTCLRVGCIPSKALLESSEKYHEATHELEQHGIKVKGVELDLAAMLNRKVQVVSALTKGIDALIKKNKITRYQGRGRFAGPGKVVVEHGEGKTTDLEGKHIIIATGSVSAPLKGVEPDGKLVLTSTEALSLEAVPKHLIVIGAGAIGLEMGIVWKRLGAKVTVLEYLDRILPGMDAQIADDARKVFEKQGIVFQLGVRVLGARVEKDSVVVECEGAKPVRGDKVLLAVGRRPNTAGLNLESIKVELDKGGRIPVGKNFATSAAGVYAIGDVIAGPMLAHKAEDEGVACVEAILSGHSHINYDTIPAVVYTQPEIGSVGRSEEQLKAAGVEYRVGTFQFRGNGRARAMAQVDGRIKVLADARTDRLLGVHILGPRAGDLIAEAAAAMEFGATAEDIARTSHAHPTLAEAFREAAMAVQNRAIHA
jgi:dihydrolipoamide dehydrogenase